MLQKASFKIRGMSRDLSASLFDSKNAYENKNIRIMTTTEDNTLLSLVNEKGTLNTNNDIIGFPIGQAEINNEVVLFTTSKQSEEVNINAEEDTATIEATESTTSDINNFDRIYKIWVENDTIKNKLLYEGSLNFNTKNPIETLSLYEGETIKKIYWVDGLNIPRVINIANDSQYDSSESFDIIQKVDKIPIITINSKENAGLFHSGTIQYVVTYNKYNGPETKIIYYSPLYGIGYNDRGAASDESVNIGFLLSVDNIDTSFDYMNIYSIHRTSKDATPTVKKILEYTISESSTEFIDSGNIGTNIDPTYLLYVGGTSFIPSTITQKDGTLFFGNYTLPNIKIPKNIKDTIKQNITLDFYLKEFIGIKSENVTYPYYNRMLSANMGRHYRKGETYRVGVQLIKNTGELSEIIYYDDIAPNLMPVTQGNNYMFNMLRGTFNSNSSTLKSTLRNLGYNKYRLVCVFPQDYEREIIAQGILCPTVGNVGNRQNNDGTYAYSSWFSRPIPITKDYLNEYDYAEVTAKYNPNYGNVLYYLPGESITESDNNTGSGSSYNYNYRRMEIQGMVNSRNLDSFFVEANIVTFHSPDVEYSTNYDNLDNNSYELYLLGGVSMCPTISNCFISVDNNSGYGHIFTNRDLLKERPISDFTQNSSNYVLAGRSTITGKLWSDRYCIDPSDNHTVNDYYERVFPIYPWHRSGPLHNFGTGTEELNNKFRTSILKHKVLSNYKISNKTVFFTEEHGINNNETNTIYASTFNSNELVSLNIKVNDTYKIYQGNVDYVISYSTTYNTHIGERRDISNPEDYWNQVSWAKEIFLNKTNTLNNNSYWTASDPVSIRYNSGKHLVFSLGMTSDSKYKILPNNSNDTYYSDNPSSVSQITYSNDTITESPTINKQPYFYLGELRRKVTNKFGGKTSTALSQNTWLAVSKFYDLDEIALSNDGDTYFTMYDTLKTYGRSEEDPNSIVEVISFFCESSINPDGRYDKNRGKALITTSPDNFNLYNSAYTQNNNFFTNSYIDDLDKNTTEYHPNGIVWSTQKTNGEKIDSWTNINFASSYDLDGIYGKISKLEVYNNSLLSFQDKAISEILFNSRVQIPTSDGVPIEISNSYKVNGARYINNSIGCVNKWSMVKTSSGIYFIDDITKGIYLFNGQLDNISDKLGFHSWINSRSNGLNIWNPKDFKGFVSYYDKVNGDIFFISDKECLAYSEPLQAFTSFYSYEHTPFFINIEDKGLFFKNTETNNTNIWLHNEGDYNMYFGEYKPFSTTIIANPESLNDKTFSTVEFRADTWNGTSLLKTSFDNLESWNEYQTGKSKLISKLGVPSNLKRKYRIWRANIPRDKSNNRDRMRNPWLYIKMEMLTPNTNKTILQDLTVTYF